MTPHSFWYQKGSAASLRLHSKADVAMSTSCIIREAQLHRPQASCPFFYSKFKFPFCLLLFFYLALNFGLASCQCSLTLIPKGLVLPSSPAGVTLKDVKYLCCPAQAAVPALGFARESPAPPSPCWGTSQSQHLEQPRACGLLLAPSLSTTKRWEVPLPAAHSTRLSGSWSDSLLDAFCPSL